MLTRSSQQLNAVPHQTINDNNYEDRRTLYLAIWDR